MALGQAAEVEDRGTGISSDSREGLGIRGMRERVGELGGNLEIASSDRGTRVRAWIPLDGVSLG